VLDAISCASENVAILLNRNLQLPPIPIKTVKKQTNIDMNESDFYYDFSPPNDIEFFEVWRVYLNNNLDKNINNVCVVIKATYTPNGYSDGKWSDVQYCGFYTNEQEAINQISGFL